MKRILRYVKGTLDYCLFYKNGEKSDLIGFTDSDFVGDIDDRKSTSGYVFLFSSAAVSWSSKKQSIVTLLTTEVEYVASTSCISQAILLRRISEEIQFQKMETALIYCDNNSIIKLLRNSVLHGRWKHIDARFHFLRDLVEDGTSELL